MVETAPPRQELTTEILDIWADAAPSVLAGKLGMATEELLQEADGLLREGAYREAEPICRYVQNLVTSDWEAWPRIKMDYTIAEGSVAFYLGTVLIAKGDGQAGLEQYHASIDRFNTRKAWLISAAIWYACARLESENCWWERGLSSFQYALNTLDMARPRPAQADALEAEIRVKFDHAKDCWIEQLQLGSVGHASSEPAPTLAPVEDNPAPPPVEKQRSEAAVELERTGPSASETFPPPPAQVRPGDIVEIPIFRDLAAGHAHSPGTAAGKDQLTNDELLDVICLDETHARGIDFGFLVRGKNMVDAGILDGDFVLVKHSGGRMPEDGQTVAVAIHGLEEDSATLKKFYNRGDHFELRPTNSSEPHIIVIPEGANREPIEDWYNEHEIPALFLVSTEVAIAQVIGIWRKV